MPLWKLSSKSLTYQDQSKNKRYRTGDDVARKTLLQMRPKSSVPAQAENQFQNLAESNRDIPRLH